jgi:hypothetical protein
LADSYVLVIAKLAISIARKMNALIFLVPEDIVDVRPRLVRFLFHSSAMYSYECSLQSDFDFRGQPNERRAAVNGYLICKRLDDRSDNECRCTDGGRYGVGVGVGIL